MFELYKYKIILKKKCNLKSSFLKVLLVLSFQIPILGLISCSYILTHSIVAVV
jgi:hypothetical protein